MSQSTGQRVTNLENTKAEFKDTFNKLKAEIHKNIKCEERWYASDKPNPENWYGLMEEDEKLHE